MPRLIAIGLLSGLFFSTTFLLNRVISINGGHWFWSASLRYVYMTLFLGIGIFAFKRGDYFKAVLSEFFRHWKFWSIAGSIGFGGFYSLLCYAAASSPGWVVAVTWEFTIVASLFVLAFFGQKLPKAVWLYMTLVFAGVLTVNIDQNEISSVKALLPGVLPVLLAGFLYPFGNQLVWEAKNGKNGFPAVNALLLNNPFAKVFLLSVGSMPFWGALYIFTDAEAPSHSQLINVALVAVFSGVIATTLFLYVRNKAGNPSQLAAVDASQSSEAIFTLGGEVLFLGAGMPNLTGLLGIAIASIGFIAFARHTH
jgi:drug/metabolite transporter (DMT)-like permease